jgi:hypothetical protein
MPALSALQSEITKTDEIIDRAWSYECDRDPPGGGEAYQYLFDALKELHEARKRVSAAQNHIRKITAAAMPVR